MSTNTQSNWQAHVAAQLATLTPILSKRGYTLAEQQPHTGGERFLMKNLTTTSGDKLILYGNDAGGKPVVIKATCDHAGRQELLHERQCRALLQNIDFAYSSFATPAELDFFTDSGYTITVQQYIDQTSTFLERPLEQQFAFALQALKTQASARITTNSHLRKVRSTFGIRTGADYLRLIRAFVAALEHKQADRSAIDTVQQVQDRLVDQQERIEQYGGFLTHTDFVPHNFRIAGDTMYLLDWSSLEFGNKHESWARFLNFMTLYNPELETLLITYVEQNRAPEERESLQLMRLYRLSELITYYTNTLQNSEGNLLALNQARVQFWRDVLLAELQNKRVERDVVAAYKTTRDQLRSAGEKERQKNLH